MSAPQELPTTGGGFALIGAGLALLGAIFIWASRLGAKAVGK